MIDQFNVLPSENKKSVVALNWLNEAFSERTNSNWKKTKQSKDS